MKVVLLALLVPFFVHAEDAMLKVAYSCANANHDGLVLQNRVPGFEFYKAGKLCAVTFDHHTEKGSVSAYRPRYNFKNRCNKAVGGEFINVKVPHEVVIEGVGGYPQHTMIMVEYTDAGEVVNDEFQCERVQ